MSHNDVERLREKLRIANAPIVVAGLATASDYFRSVLGVNPLDPAHLEYLAGIDFHRAVRVDPLEVGTLLVRFPEIKHGVIQPERIKPYRFFATPGATPLHLGWNPEENGFQLYQLCQSVRALVSFASAIRFGDRSSVHEYVRDFRSRLGGDRQVVVPWSTHLRLLRERDYDRHKLAAMLNAGYLPLGLS